MPNINDVNNLIYHQEGVFLPSVKFPSAFVGNASSGNVDLYTCPSGKRAMVNYITLYNTAGTSTTVFPQIYVSGTYYKISGSGSVSASTTGALMNNNKAIILEGGERISVNTTQAGMNVWANIVEFDNTAAIKTSKILNPSSGTTTVYTCPAGKNAFNIDISFTANYSQYKCFYFNNTGSSASTTWYCVPSGGSAGTNNIIGTETVNSGANQIRNFGSAILTPGDFFAFNTTIGTAGQIAWVNVWEL